MKIQAEFVFPGHLKDEAIICYLCKNFDINLSILEASFSTETGWAILILDGSKENVTKTVGYLLRKGVEIRNEQEIA